MGSILVASLYKLQADPQAATAYAKGLELLEKCVPLMVWKFPVFFGFMPLFTILTMHAPLAPVLSRHVVMA